MVLAHDKNSIGLYLRVSLSAPSSRKGGLARLAELPLVSGVGVAGTDVIVALDIIERWIAQLLRCRGRICKKPEGEGSKTTDGPNLVRDKARLAYKFTHVLRRACWLTRFMSAFNPSPLPRSVFLAHCLILIQSG